MSPVRFMSPDRELAAKPAPATAPAATQSLSLPFATPGQSLPVTLLSTESLHSSPLNDNTLATVKSSPPAGLQPYEAIASDGVIAGWEAEKPVHLRGRAEGEAGSTVTLTIGRFDGANNGDNGNNGNGNGNNEDDE